MRSIEDTSRNDCVCVRESLSVSASVSASLVGQYDRSTVGGQVGRHAVDYAISAGMRYRNFSLSYVGEMLVKWA